MVGNQGPGVPILTPPKYGLKMSYLSNNGPETALKLVQRPYMSGSPTNN